MNRIPSVDELVQAALEGGTVSVIESPPVEKIAAVTDASSDVMEQTASELEKWAEQIEGHQEEQSQISAHNQEETTHNRVLKLAMASTILNTLQGLSDHGQLDQLIEKVAVARFARTAAGAVYRKGGAALVARRHAGQRMQDPFRKMIGRTGESLARVGGGPTAGEISVRQAAAKAKGTLKAEAAKQKARATVAEAATAGERTKGEQARELMKKWRLGAGAAGAAGVAGAGLAYQAGAKRERERARATQRFRRYR